MQWCERPFICCIYACIVFDQQRCYIHMLENTRTSQSMWHLWNMYFLFCAGGNGAYRPLWFLFPLTHFSTSCVYVAAHLFRYHFILQLHSYQIIHQHMCNWDQAQNCISAKSPQVPWGLCQLQEQTWYLNQHKTDRVNCQNICRQIWISTTNLQGCNTCDTILEALKVNVLYCWAT